MIRYFSISGPAANVVAGSVAKRVYRSRPSLENMTLGTAVQSANTRLATQAAVRKGLDTTCINTMRCHSGLAKPARNKEHARNRSPNDATTVLKNQCVCKTCNSAARATADPPRHPRETHQRPTSSADTWGLPQDIQYRLILRIMQM